MLNPVLFPLQLLFLSCLLLSACQPTPGLHTDLPSGESQNTAEHTITPRTKGSTLEITPRTKGTTYLLGSLHLPAGLAVGDFKIALRQENLLLNPQPLSSNAQGQFEIPALSLNPNQALYIEARSLQRPDIVLMNEMMVPDKMPEKLEFKLDITTTAAVYTARYLALSAESTAQMSGHPEVLAPVSDLLLQHFTNPGAAQSLGENMMDMPEMNQRLAEAGARWLALQTEETP